MYLVDRLNDVELEFTPEEFADEFRDEISKAIEGYIKEYPSCQYDVLDKKSGPDTRWISSEEFWSDESFFNHFSSSLYKIENTETIGEELEVLGKYFYPVLVN